MPAQLVADLQRAFQIDAAADAPVAEVGLRQRLGRGLTANQSGAELDRGEAAAGAGDRGAERDRSPRSSPARRCSACRVRRRAADFAHGADIGDDAGEHSAAPCSALSSTSSPSGSIEQARGISAHVASFSTPKACDRRRAVAAHHHRRMEPGDPVDQPRLAATRRRAPRRLRPARASNRACPARRKRPSDRSRPSPRPAPRSARRRSRARPGSAPHRRRGDGRSRSALACASATSFAVSGVRRLPSITMRTGLRPPSPGNRQVSCGSSATTVPTPTITASCSRAADAPRVARRFAGDPLALAMRCRDAAVERRRELQRDERPAFAGCA